MRLHLGAPGASRTNVLLDRRDARLERSKPVGVTHAVSVCEATRLSEQVRQLCIAPVEDSSRESVAGPR